MEYEVDTGQLRFHLPPGPDQSRWVGTAFVRFLLDAYHLRVPLYQGDIELALIGDVVGLFSRGHYPSDIDLERSEGATLATITAAIGLPRETVRRKLGRLVAQGYIDALDNGRYALRPGVLRTEPYWQAIGELSDKLASLINLMLRERFYLPGTSENVPSLNIDFRAEPTDLPDRKLILMRLFVMLYLQVYRLRAPHHRYDLKMIVIQDTVGEYVARHMFDDPHYREVFSSLSVRLGEYQHGCTLRWIAKATGLPRETVRRKVAALIEDDFLAVSADGGYIHRPGKYQTDMILSCWRSIEACFRAFLNDCLDEGLFRLVAAGPGGDGAER